MENRKFIKTKKNEWEYYSNGFLAVIEKKGAYYYATAYRDRGKEYDREFTFPRMRHIKDMKEMIASNGKFVAPKSELQGITKPMQTATAAPCPRFKSRTADDTEYWWND